MNRMEITGPGADYQIQMKRILSGEQSVNRIEANKAYNSMSSYGKNPDGYFQKSSAQSLRWMDRYFISLAGIKETDTITFCDSLEKSGKKAHRLGVVTLRPSVDTTMLQKQAELIAEGTGLELTEELNPITKIRQYVLQLPFSIKNSCISVELDNQENSYVIVIQELAFKKQCNEVIKKFLSWWDSNLWQLISTEVLFLKRFCELKSDRLRSEEQRRELQQSELNKIEHRDEWKERTETYASQVDWEQVTIGLNFSMLDSMGAAVELALLNLPETELSREGILIPKKIHFAELDQGIIIEHQLDFFPEKFKTRLLCAMVKYLNEIYKEKQPDFYEYKKWHMICERRDFTMKFSRRFTFYSEERLGIVRGRRVSFAEWERTMMPGEYADLYEEE